MSSEIIAPAVDGSATDAAPDNQPSAATPSVPPVSSTQTADADPAPAESTRIVDWMLAGVALVTFIVLAGSLRIWTAMRPKRPAKTMAPIELKPAVEPATAPVREPAVARERVPVREPASVREPVVDRPRLQLRTLLKNQIAFTEEACVLPLPLEFYGRPAGIELLHADRLRAAAVSPPHFALSAKDLASATGETLTETAPEPAQSTNPNRRTDASHPFASAQRPHGVPHADGRPSVLDRVLTRLDGESH